MSTLRFRLAPEFFGCPLQALLHRGRDCHSREGSVPAYPGSHGCIRVTVAEMDILYPQLPIGLTVDVYY